MWSARCRGPCGPGRGPGPGRDPRRCLSRVVAPRPLAVTLPVLLLVTLLAAAASAQLFDEAAAANGTHPDPHFDAVAADGTDSSPPIAAAAVNRTYPDPPPCSEEMSVLLTGRTKQRADNALVASDGEVFWPGTWFITDNDEIRGCPCELRTCFFKCCAPGQVLFWSKDMARKECVNRTSWRDEVPAGVFDIALPEFLLDLYSEGDLTEATQRAVPVPAHWRVMVSERHRQNKNGMFKLNSNQDPDDFFYLLEKNASLLVPKYTMSIFAPGTFCLDLFVVMRNTSDGEVSVSTELSALVPFMDVEGEVAVSAIVGILYPIGLLISIPFLVATFAVYCTYSELRNLPGKSLMCYVASMIAGYLLLSLVQLNLDVDNMTCLVLGFCLQFSFLACFFWLNVMCFDIWRTFSGFRGSHRPSGSGRELRRFLLYSLYAWGCPLLILVVTVFAHLYAGRLRLISPAMGEDHCYFGTDEAKYAYFYGPVAVLLLVNMCLFLHTAVRILQLRRETSVLKSAESQRHNDERQRYNVYLKLFLIMGVNWIAEIMSMLFPDPSYLWLLSDVTNSLQGILVFIMFVGTGRVRRIVLRKGITQNTSSYATKTSRLTATGNGTTTTCCNGSSRASTGPGVVVPASPDVDFPPGRQAPATTPAEADSTAPAPAPAPAGATPAPAPATTPTLAAASAPAALAGALSPQPSCVAPAAATSVEEGIAPQRPRAVDASAGPSQSSRDPGAGGPTSPTPPVAATAELPDCVLDSIKTVGADSHLGAPPRQVSEENGRNGLEPVDRSQHR